MSLHAYVHMLHGLLFVMSLEPLTDGRIPGTWTSGQVFILTQGWLLTVAGISTWRTLIGSVVAFAMMEAAVLTSTDSLTMFL